MSVEDIQRAIEERQVKLDKLAEEWVDNFIRDALVEMEKGGDRKYLAVSTSMSLFVMEKTKDHPVFKHSPTIFWFNANERLLAYRADGLLEFGLCVCETCDKMGTGRAKNGHEAVMKRKMKIGVKRRRLDPIEECKTRLMEMIAGDRDSVVLMNSRDGVEGTEKLIATDRFFEEVSKVVSWQKSGERAIVFMMRECK